MDVSLGQAFQQRTASRDFGQQLVGRSLRWFAVEVRMISQIVTFLGNAADDVRILRRFATHDEEGRLDSKLVQDVQDLRSALRIGTVVKGQRNLSTCVRTSHSPPTFRQRDG